MELTNKDLEFDAVVSEKQELEKGMQVQNSEAQAKKTQ
jgi:hypothetical protein